MPSELSEEGCFPPEKPCIERPVAGKTTMLPLWQAKASWENLSIESFVTKVTLRSDHSLSCEPHCRTPHDETKILVWHPCTLVSFGILRSKLPSKSLQRPCPVPAAVNWLVFTNKSAGITTYFITPQLFVCFANSSLNHGNSKQIQNLVHRVHLRRDCRGCDYGKS